MYFGESLGLWNVNLAITLIKNQIHQPICPNIWITCISNPDFTVLFEEGMTKLWFSGVQEYIWNDQSPLRVKRVGLSSKLPFPSLPSINVPKLGRRWAIDCKTLENSLEEARKKVKGNLVTCWTLTKQTCTTETERENGKERQANEASVVRNCRGKN